MTAALGPGATRDDVHRAAIAAGWRRESSASGVDTYVHCTTEGVVSHEVTIVYGTTDRVIAAHACDWAGARNGGGRFVGFPATHALHHTLTRKLP